MNRQTRRAQEKKDFSYRAAEEKFMRDEDVEIKNPDFRPHTKTKMRDVIFKFMRHGEDTAALGDMICWLPAIRYIAENYNFLYGHLVVPKWFMEIAVPALAPFPNWKVYDGIPEKFKDGYPIKEQLLFPINATGMHLIDLGFVYFLHTLAVPPEARQYLGLELNGVKLPEELQGKSYVVLTPCSEAHTRTMLPSAFNGIVDHVISKGLTPVFLGKLNLKERSISIPEKYDLSRGINLINKTTLLEAAKIIEKSEMIIGIDNGLLHLAAMTDATILYGYTMAGPEQRGIRRKYGHTYELHADKEKVPCLFCQERVRYFFDHNFAHCLYRENEPACIKALNKESWCATIDRALKEKYK